ncbi:sulfate adenylyltransferase subunit 1 [Ruminiclostridium josui]|uniref:sulfate adenylyltransferase subunit 1 n=1 Tax=Ruminiclostridium josui TaxID=1499 RepID=UPI000464D08E|nr:GTP-binding protein [Ruminiclostridium josui]
MDNREQMNIVIVGHVDHGKSTVIGRLLADTGSLPEGKLESVKEYCRKNSRPFEYAFLLDALKDEQAQGITIDTARCFFKTNKRDYIIIDAPGHIEFLKNMVTGASRAEAALLVIDANEGIKENSKRHGHIVSMLGIKQVVVLVNKMDLVDFNKDVYKSITEEFTEFLSKINIKPINFIPISAFNGDNIADKSCLTSWYDGPTVLAQLDSFENRKEDIQLPFRMPVQDIYKFTEENDHRRIVAGTILSGTIKAGDEVVFLPSKKKSVVNSIEGFNVVPTDKAAAGQAIGLTLKTQIYIKAGELMVRADEVQPVLSSRFRVNIFWVGKFPLIKNKNYKLKIGTLRITVKLAEILNIIDAAELNINTVKNQVERHDVAECILETVKPIAFDPISQMETTGRFVIVDNYEISGGGIILEGVSEKGDTLHSQISEKEFLWEQGLVSPNMREDLYGHKGIFVVLTSGNEEYVQSIHQNGKELEYKLFKSNHITCYLGIPSAETPLASGDRDSQILQIGELAEIFTNAGQIFITSVFNLDDYEAEKLKLLIRNHEVRIINIGESPFNNFIPDAHIKDSDNERIVDSLYDLLKSKK